MRVRGAIVQKMALPMFNIREKVATRYTATAQFVGDEDPRHILKALQQPLEESLRRPGIVAVLHQDVEHHAVLVDGAQR